MNSTDSVDVQQVIDRARVSATQKMALALCLVFGVVDGVTMSIVGFIIPALSAEWGRSPASLTPVALAPLIAGAVGALFLAPLADTVGRRPYMLAGTGVFGVSTLAAALAPNAGLLTLALVIAGLAYGAVPAVVYTYVTEMAPTRRRGILVSMIGAGMTAGGALCGLAAGFMISALGWRSLYVLGGALGVVIAVLAVRLVPETLQFLAFKGRRQQVLNGIAAIDSSVTVAAGATFVLPEGDAEKSPLRSLFGDGRGRMTITFWVLFLCHYLGAIFIFTWLPTVLTSAGVDATTALFAASAFPFGGVIGSVFLGMAVDRVTRKFHMLTGSFAVGLAGVVVSAYSTSIVVVLILALFVAGVGVVGSGVALNPVIAGLYPARVRATAIGSANGWGRVGAVMGPALGGVLLAAGFSSRALFLSSLVPVLVCAACTVLLSAMVRSAQPRREPRRLVVEPPAG